MKSMDIYAVVERDIQAVAVNQVSDLKSTSRSKFYGVDEKPVLSMDLV